MDYSQFSGSAEDMSDFLDRCMPAYDVSFYDSMQLDISRQIWDADNYYPWVVAFPGARADCLFNVGTVAPVTTFQTFTGDITLPPYSWLTKISYFAQQTTADGFPNGTLEPFKLRVYDKGGKVDMIQKQFGWMNNVAGSMIPPAGLGTQDSPFGPYYLLEPKVLMPPGVLHLEVTDMGGVPAYIQVALMFSVPLVPPKG